ncbi:MAG: flagellar regulator YcgR PilZN domain-containing protein [Pseudomonadota bacterium]
MEQIRFRPQILTLLQRMQDGRCLLAVNLNGDSYQFNSALLEINTEQGYLVLDELKPNTGHELFLQQQRCRVRTSLKGITVSFIVTLISSGQENGIAYYRVALPDSISYGQRRAHFRPKVSRAFNTEVQLDLPGGDTISGTLQDISLGGLRIKADRELIDLTAGTPLTCRFQIPGGESIECSLDLRFFSRNDHGCQLGGQFQRLDPLQRRALQKFITLLERDAIRKSPREGT